MEKYTRITHREREVIMTSLSNGLTYRSIGRELGRKQMRLRVTYDRGKEMTQHELFTKGTGMQVYFCDPHAPRQLGTNENTNMLIRGFFKLGTDLNQYTRNQIKRVQNLLNERPRKTLDWQTPKERFNQPLVAIVA